MQVANIKSHRNLMEYPPHLKLVVAGGYNFVVCRITNQVIAIVKLLSGEPMAYLEQSKTHSALIR